MARDAQNQRLSIFVLKQGIDNYTLSYPLSLINNAMDSVALLQVLLPAPVVSYSLLLSSHLLTCLSPRFICMAAKIFYDPS